VRPVGHGDGEGAVEAERAHCVNTMMVSGTLRCEQSAAPTILKPGKFFCFCVLRGIVKMPLRVAGFKTEAFAFFQPVEMPGGGISRQQWVFKLRSLDAAQFLCSGTRAPKAQRPHTHMVRIKTIGLPSGSLHGRVRRYGR